jgi:hypothetical protein
VSKKSRDLGIALLLLTFCGVMTYFLIRSEYYPNSTLQEVPLQTVLSKVFRHQSTSPLRVFWRDEEMGIITIRLLSGSPTFMNVKVDVVLPVLGEKPKLQCDVDCRFSKSRELTNLKAVGKVDEVKFDISSDQKVIKLKVKGGGWDEERELPIKNLRLDDKDLSKSIPELKEELSARHIEQAQSLIDQWKWSASASRLQRKGDWIDTYVIKGELDQKIWIRLWLTQTGELLKVDSGFGLNAVNEDFFGTENPVITRKP